MAEINRRTFLPLLSVLALALACQAGEQLPVRLAYSVGLADGALDSDGVEFRVALVDAEGRETVLAEHKWDKNAWQDGQVDLTRHAGREVVVRFVTSPGATTTYDWACWGEPRVLVGDRVVTDLTRTKIWRARVLANGRVAPMDSRSTGACFRLSERTCGGVTKRGFLAHPPYRGPHAGGSAFAEFKLTVGQPPTEAPPRPSMPFLPPETSPFPMGDTACFRLPGPITVDGSLDDWPAGLRRACLCVRDRVQISFERVSHKPGFKAGWTGPHDLSSAFYLGWDDDALYLAEVRRDDLLQFMDTMSEDFLGSDALRVVVSRLPAGDALTADDCVFAILPQGEQDKPMVRRCAYGRAKPDDPGVEGIQAAPRLYAGGWVMEVKIPFATMGIRPQTGMSLGFQLLLTDSDTPMDRHYEMQWRPKDATQQWRDPSTFGRVTLCQDSFAWIEMKRRVFALGERPLLQCGLFSLAGVEDAALDVRLRPRQGQAVSFCAAQRAGSGATAWCHALSQLGAQTIECSLVAGRDKLTQSMSIDVVKDRGEIDLTKLSQPAEPTLLPSVASGSYANRARRRGDAFVFEYAGEDESIQYVLRPGVGFDLEVLADRERLYRSDPAATGPMLPGQSKAPAGQVADAELKGRVLTFACRLADGAEVAYRVTIEGKTLVVDVESGQARFADFRGPLFGLNADEVFVPYLERRMAAYLVKGRFVSSYCDWTATGASYLRRFGSSSYLAKTDGTRNPLRERVYVTASSELLEVLPNLPNPKSRFHDVLARKVVLDCWGWGSRFSDTGRYLETLKGYGVDELAIIFHVWQRQGYDNGLPEHYPANEGRGGDADMRTLGATAKRLGHLFSLHENYIDYYPNFPGYTEDALALNSAGAKVKAWYMPSTKIQSYRLKPSWIERYVRGQSPEIHRRYQTTAAYLDVHSVNLPFQMDFDARAEGAASFGYSFDKLTWLFNFMRQTHQGPLFGEGNMHAVWAGRVDGCEAQVGGRGGEVRPVLVDYDLLKVHPLAVNHGMGYYSRWHRTRRGRLSDEDMDKYRSQELAYGHAGFFNTGVMQNLTQTLREYYIVQSLQSAYAPAKVKRIRYLFDVGPSGDGQWVSARVACRTAAPRKIHVAYDNGLELWINDHREGWSVAGHVLPAHGFVARGPGIQASTARRNEGCVADYVETPTRIFADPRTYEALYSDRGSAVDVIPLAPEVVPQAGARLKITYRFAVDERIGRDYIVFVHFTDADGRILWQNDHRPRTPTSQWPVGKRYVDGPHEVEVPARIGPATYDIRVGLYMPKSGRLALSGHDAGDNSYLVGRLRVDRPGGGPGRVVFVPRPEAMSGHRLGRNRPGVQVDFGKVRTNITLVIHRQDGRLRLMPIPHGARGAVGLKLDQLLPGPPARDVEVWALGADNARLAQIAARRERGVVAFETSNPKAWHYEVSPR